MSTPEEKEYTKDELEQIIRKIKGMEIDTNDYSKSFGGSKAMAQEEKAFADMAKMGDKEAEETPFGVVSGKSLSCGKWHKFLNAQGSCYLYIHNITKDVTSIRPENYEDEPEAKVEAGDANKEAAADPRVPLKDLERELNRCKEAGKVPLFLVDEETHENLLTFYKYKGKVIDTKPLALGAVKTGVSTEKCLETCRKTMVAALKEGRLLLVDLGAELADFKGKICVLKNRDSFPQQVFMFGKLSTSKLTYEKIYRDEDKEAGQCVVRDGFEVAVCAVVPSVTIDAIKEKVPGFEGMEVIQLKNN